MNLLALALTILAAVALWDMSFDAGTPARFPVSRPYLVTPWPDLMPGRAKVMRVLIVGADDRESRGRADTIMLALVNPRGGRAALLSIQRDTRTKIPGHSTDKINHAYKFGNVDLLQATVETLLGLEIHHYVKLDFDSFEKSIDALGGVRIDVPDIEGHGRGMNYDDVAGNLHIHITPGEQLLMGEDAMGYARYRRDSDIKRAKRQRELLKAMVRQHLHGGAKKETLDGLRELMKGVETNMPKATALRLATAFANTPHEHIKSVMLPCSSDRRNGIYYSKVDELAAQETLDELHRFVRGDQNAPIRLKDCGVVVLNGSRVQKAAALAARKLEAAGVHVTNTDNAKHSEHKRTVLRYHSGGREAAEEVRSLLGISRAQLLEDPDFRAPGGASIIVTLGADIQAAQ